MAMNYTSYGPIGAVAFALYPSADIGVDTHSSTTITYDSERYDTGNNCTTTTFTAPVTGKYQLTFSLSLHDAASTYYYLYIQTSNHTYYGAFLGASGERTGRALSVVADMDASDTAYTRIAASGGSQTHDFMGNWTFFSGVLVG